ncbi:hypothetical protein M947_06075 [Sulfurimonas hongkongensis]|uniref:Uncharacterized protein n=1 Tax=Sulfurimonas hongkongensis TaxID=1172190 RepID=T0JN26_9BACT|nr:hypothetical protein M947_06075 [Sulfurimonas hongkongensis]
MTEVLLFLTPTTCHPELDSGSLEGLKSHINIKSLMRSQVKPAMTKKSTNTKKKEKNAKP